MFVVTLIIVWHSVPMLDASSKGSEMTHKVLVHDSLDEVSLLKERVKELELKLDSRKQEANERNTIMEEKEDEITKLPLSKGLKNVSNELQRKYSDESKPVTKHLTETAIIHDDHSHQGKSRFKKGIPPQFNHTERQKAVVSAFKHAWKGYKDYSWGYDELRPLSKTKNTWFDLGLTLVDSLDTMWLMGLKEEFEEARDWVANKLFVQQNRDVNLFETTIRVLGGLLSTYHFTDDHIFLDKAVCIYFICTQEVILKYH